jgi:hypothetical protein
MAGHLFTSDILIGQLVASRTVSCTVSEDFNQNWKVNKRNE